MKRCPTGSGSRWRLRASLVKSWKSTLEESQLVIRGRQTDDKSRQYLHRGIAARQFQRAFLLADGMEVLGAELMHGLLSVDLARPEPARIIRKIDILAKD